MKLTNIPVFTVLFYTLILSLYNMPQETSVNLQIAYYLNDRITMITLLLFAYIFVDTKQQRNIILTGILFQLIFAVFLICLLNHSMDEWLKTISNPKFGLMFIGINLVLFTSINIVQCLKNLKTGLFNR